MFNLFREINRFLDKCKVFEVENYLKCGVVVMVDGRFLKVVKLFGFKLMSVVVLVVVLDEYFLLNKIFFF